MNVSTVQCDECGRLKGEGNHWHQIGLLAKQELVTLILGDQEMEPGRDWTYSIHDLCGEQCFFKHIGKLLRLNPTEAE